MQQLLRESRFAETWQIDKIKYCVTESKSSKHIFRYYSLSNGCGYSVVAIATANKDEELLKLEIICNFVYGAEKFISDYEVEPYTYDLHITCIFPGTITKNLEFKPITIYVKHHNDVKDEFLPMCILRNEFDVFDQYRNCDVKSIINDPNKDLIYSIAKRLQNGESITTTKSARR